MFRYTIVVFKNKNIFYVPGGVSYEFTNFFTAAANLMHIKLET
jgi:hypothetical protein